MHVFTPLEFGKALKERRKKLKLTQLDVAGLSGVGNRFIVELEAGKKTIEIGKALFIAHMLGFKVSLS
jgi:HTH-type transcriptional regulator / antitoxin HipB